MEGNEGVEESSQHVEERRLDEISVPSMVEGVPAFGIFDTPNVEGIDLAISSK